MGRLYVSSHPTGERAELKALLDTIIMALCVAFGRTACDYTLRYRFGGGRHIWDIPPEMLSGNITLR